MREEIENTYLEKTATEKAVEKLEEAIIESKDLSPEEIEEEILAVPGAEEGEGLDRLRKEVKKEERKRKRMIH